jgi:pimeloyl-ACP methyl ester carboxylesterase
LHEVLDTIDANWFARISLAGDSPYRPIVMVHGVVVSGAYFQPVAECLDDDFDLYIPDLPGTGQSLSHTGHWTIPQLAAGLAGWMDQHGLADAILVSNSIGCQVLTMLAISRPDLVRTLILVSPTMDPDVSSAVRLMARGVLDLPRERLGLWKVWIHDLLRTGPVEGLRTVRDAIDDPQVARLPLIQAPVIVVGGEHDPIVPRRWVDEMAASLPRGRAVIIPNAPHALNFTSPRRLSWIIRAAAGAWPDTRRD